MRRLVLIVCFLLLTGDADAGDLRHKQVVSRVKVNGSILTLLRPTLNVTGPVVCSDNLAGASTDCSCPNTGILTQGVIQITPSKQGQLDVLAPWVTANSFIVCTPVAVQGVRISVSLIPDSIRPGQGFSIAVTAPDVTIGAFNIGCIGAVPQ